MYPGGVEAMEGVSVVKFQVCIRDGSQIRIDGSRTSAAARRRGRGYVKRARAFGHALAKEESVQH